MPEHEMRARARSEALRLLSGNRGPSDALPPQAALRGRLLPATVMLALCAGGAGAWWLRGMSMSAPPGGQANTEGITASSSKNIQANPHQARDGASDAHLYAAQSGGRITAAGFIRTDQISTVSTEITGTISHIYVARGDTVKRGERIATLDSRVLQSELDASRASQLVARSNLEQARGRLPAAQAQAKRMAELQRRGFVSSQNTETAETELIARTTDIKRYESELRYASIQIDRKQTDLARATIRAPFDATVVSLNAAAGEIVSPISAAGGFARSGIATLIGNNRYFAEVWVPENLLGKISEHQSVQVTPNALPNLRVDGEVTHVSPVVDEQRAAVLVQIALKTQPAQLKHNMSVQVEFR